MKRIFSFISLLFITLSVSYGQEEDIDELLPEPPVSYKLKLQRYRYVKPVIEGKDTMWCYLLPELPIYAPLKFKNERQRKAYNKLIYNIKKVLPLAQEANSLIEETYLVLEQLPDKKAKDQHIRNVERDIKEQYTPQMKKLTYSQGKLLIKLIDRECHSTGYDMIKAFMGPIRAGFWQVFAWGFGASLKKEYDAKGVDRLTERVVLMVEAGQI